ncbi:MAG: peptidase S41 [Thalassobius sp.]|nr:peptidase S41 [Thalassovita sp.]
MKNLIFILLICSANLVCAQIPNTISNEEKIYGLSKFWQEVNYNFVYLSKVDKQAWDSLYLASIKEVQTTKNDYEYYRKLQKFSAFLKDGHTNIILPKSIYDNIFNASFGDYKFKITNIEGKAIITGINDSKKNKIAIGSEITKVNGIPTSQYIETYVKPYIATSTPHLLEDLSIQYMLEGYLGTAYTLEVKSPDGKTKNLELTLGETKEEKMYPAEEKRELLEFKWLDEKVAYLAFNSFSDWDIMDRFDEIQPELTKAEKLIIDLRYNGGGDSRVARELFKYLTKDTKMYGAKSQSRLHIPSYKAWGKYVNASDTLKNERMKQSYLTYQDAYFYTFPYEAYETSNLDITRIEVPTVLLIGHMTGSAAEDFLIYADNQENMTKIGEATYGSTGQPYVFDLPGGAFARVCTKKDTYANGKEFVGYGIQPDIEVKKTLADFMENIDPALQKAIAFLSNSN